MIKQTKAKFITLFLACFFITSCGDFPDYSYDQSEEHCVMSFPFAGGIIGRQYIGYFRVISSLQYLDAEPSYKIIATGPSHIELEAGSFQKLIINNKEFKPKFDSEYLEAELQLWGPTFVFDEIQSAEIYQLLKQGYNLDILGRIEVGHQYETRVYNFFFDSADEPFKACINRLLNEEDLKLLAQQKLKTLSTQNSK